MRIESFRPSPITMTRSGEQGLAGKGERSTANAFVVAIDNRIAAISGKFFVFMTKPYRSF